MKKRLFDQRTKPKRMMEEEGATTGPIALSFFWNDCRKNRLVTVAIVCFLAISAMFMGLTVLLSGSLLSSISRLMETAMTPHFLQMHSGELDRDALERFASSHPEVEKMQVVTFLNLENDQLSLGGRFLDDNNQDNGLALQSPSFDYLLGLDGEVLDVAAGEVYVPICYRTEYELSVGEEMQISTEKLKIAGFLRDSQMNSMMASSKRFLVSERDYERLKPSGEEEYIIEFRIKEGIDVSAFASAYAQEGLASNGPAITYPLIRLMNALSDGMMILVILLASLVILGISILCIRYILLTSLEKDKREIGMLKAIGLSKRDIRGLYFLKFALLSVAGILLGGGAAYLTWGFLGRQIEELYGPVAHPVRIWFFTLVGILLVEGMILLSVRRTLRVTERLSAVDALFGRGSFERKKNRYLFLAFVTTASAALAVIPQGLASTLSSPGFVNYMGIGQSQIRIDVRQGADLEGLCQEVAGLLMEDTSVKGSVLMETRGYQMVTEDGRQYRIPIEKGDHSRYPVRYGKGTWPSSGEEIALSELMASEIGVVPGDVLTVYPAEGDPSQEVQCKVCGIYGDVTNGGKTAKCSSAMPSGGSALMWGILYLDLQENCVAEEWISEFQEKISALPAQIRVAQISQYVLSMYGQTISMMEKAATLTLIATCLILAIVSRLFVRLLIWQERGGCSLKKALGFASRDIRMAYLKRCFFYVLGGVVAGLVLGLGPGQQLSGLFIESLGASGFAFQIQPERVFVLIPLALLLTALSFAYLSLREVDTIRPYECCVRRE